MAGRVSDPPFRALSGRGRVKDPPYPATAARNRERTNATSPCNA